MTTVSTFGIAKGQKMETVPIVGPLRALGMTTKGQANRFEI
jgi:hypothetical protein